MWYCTWFYWAGQVIGAVKSPEIIGDLTWWITRDSPPAHSRLGSSWEVSSGKHRSSVQSFRTSGSCHLVARHSSRPPPAPRKVGKWRMSKSGRHICSQPLWPWSHTCHFAHIFLASPSHRIPPEEDGLGNMVILCAQEGEDTEVTARDAVP